MVASNAAVASCADSTCAQAAAAAAAAPVVCEPVETKTARRRRLKAMRLTSPEQHAQHALEQRVLADREKQRRRLRKKLCSEYWVGEVLEGREYAPNVPCTCEGCEGRQRHPSPCVGLIAVNPEDPGDPRRRRLSYECHLAGLPLGRMVQTPSSPVVRRATAGEAAEAGLSVRRSGVEGETRRRLELSPGVAYGVVHAGGGRIGVRTGRLRQAVGAGMPPGHREAGLVFEEVGGFDGWNLRDVFYVPGTPAAAEAQEKGAGREGSGVSEGMPPAPIAA